MHHYETVRFSRAKSPSHFRLPLLFWASMIAAVVLSVVALSQQITAGSEDDITPQVAPLEEITIITTDGCPACVNLKDEWNRNLPGRRKLAKRAKVRWVQIETVPAAVNSKGEIIPVRSVASLAKLLPKTGP